MPPSEVPALRAATRPHTVQREPVTVSLRALSRWGLPLLLLVAILACWEIAGVYLRLPEYILPAPSKIAGAFVQHQALLARHVVPTAQEAALGFVFGNGLAIILAVAFVHSATTERVVYPLAVAMRSIPFVALAPILLIWLGNGPAPKVALASLGCFFPTLVNVVRGLKALDREAFELMYTLSASWWQVLWKLRWPTAMPYLFSALKIAAPSCVIGAIGAEWIGSDQGLGYLVVTSTYEFRIPLLWAVIAVASAMAIGLFLAVVWAEHWLAPWSLQQADHRQE